MPFDFLIKSLKSKGVQFINKKLETQEEFINEHTVYDVVFNCLGLGSNKFCNDKNIIPMRGQMIRVSLEINQIKREEFKKIVNFKKLNLNRLKLHG